MDRHDVVVIVVTQTAMPAIGIEFADGVGELAGVVAGVEDGDAVGGERDRAALEVTRRDQNRRSGRQRHERDTPVIGHSVTERSGVIGAIGRARKVGCGKGHLLLPRSDADHQIRHDRRIRYRIRFLVKVGCIPSVAHLGFERCKRRRHQRCIARSRYGRGSGRSCARGGTDGTR